MSPADFARHYEAALRTQQWDAVSPLIHPDASVTFSDGSVHKGKDAVRAAYERNFAAIKNEDYRVSNIHWLAQEQDFATYLFDFHWTGLIGGKTMSGSGRGTTVLTRLQDQWQLLAEHLGRA